MMEKHVTGDASLIPPEHTEACIKATKEMLDLCGTMGRPDIALTALLSAYTTIAINLPSLTAQAAGYTALASQMLGQAVADRPATSLH